RLERFRPAVHVLTAVLLWVAIGTPLGWLTGDVRSTNYVTHERLTRLGTIFGAAAGAATGLVSGLWVECGKRRSPRVIERT
ncbi:MAG TPA: hypothetical protein VFG68_17340, partial [Fimbriiglobus sp.]|nr:hypothetical protein [Fimbriiglobus sp.]